MPSRSESNGSIGSSPSHESKPSISKADPNLALHEAQPMSNFTSSDSVFSLRSMQHRDKEGNVISNPDISNPTRYRFERPLDTIRSFEANIERRRRENF